MECVPAYGSFSLELPVKENPKPDPSWKSLFSLYQDRLPKKSEDWGFKSSRPNGKLLLSIRPPGGESLRTAEFFPYDQFVIENPAEQALEREGENWKLDLSIAPEALSAPRRLSGILVVNREKAYEVDVPVAAALSGLGPLLGLAFMGGLLLNLMPCVFPVLSIKVLGFLEHSRNGDPRLHGLSFASGILVSFWALAGLLLLLRAQGERLGWGFQLQSPAFLIALAALFVFLGLNLLGLFEIGSGWMRLGGLASGTGGLRRSFFSGALAAVVATPCTAPFMGTAIGAALALPAAAALAIFTSLALGMSFPYAALTFYPSGLRWLPRPGPWMETLKQALAFPLLATSVWLLWVLGRQLGLPSLGQMSAALWAASLFLWAWKRFDSAGARTLAGSVAALAIGAVLLGSPAPAVTWEPYSEESLRAHLLRKRDVFVNFTAAWCVTCQVNERIAFRNPEARKALKRPGLALLKADWTSRDPEITSALENLGRSGVPVYALFSPDAPPKLLPAVLTPGILVEALEKKK